MGQSPRVSLNKPRRNPGSPCLEEWPWGLVQNEQDGVPAALTGGRRGARLCKGYQLQAGGQAETPCPHGSDGPAWPTALYTGHTLLGQETPCSPQPRTRWPCLNTSSPGHSLARPQGITYASSLGCAQCLPDPGYRAEAYISTAFLTSPSLRLLPQQPPSGFYGRGVR